MIDPAIKQILFTTFTWAFCGSAIFTIGRVINRKNPGPRIEQAAAIGFLIGAAFGACFGIFQSLTVR